MAIETAPQINLIRGDGHTIKFAFTDENGAVIDITGKTLFFTVKQAFDVDDTDAAAAIKKSVTVHTNAAGGLSQVVLTKTDTKDLVPGFYFWDSQLLSSGGDPASTIYGKLRVWNDVTRRIT